MKYEFLDSTVDALLRCQDEDTVVPTCLEAKSAINVVKTSYTMSKETIRSQYIFSAMGGRKFFETLIYFYVQF